MTEQEQDDLHLQEKEPTGDPENPLADVSDHHELYRLAFQKEPEPVDSESIPPDDYEFEDFADYVTKNRDVINREIFVGVPGIEDSELVNYTLYFEANAHLPVDQAAAIARDLLIKERAGEDTAQVLTSLGMKRMRR